MPAAPAFFEPVPAIDASAVDAAAFALRLRGRGIRDTAVLGAMERVPRPLFAPGRFADLARTDVALPLPCGQTMTGPSVIATMLIALDAPPGGRVLEIGSGSGYVTALLSHLRAKVTSVERFAALAEEARTRLRVLGAPGEIDLVTGDGLDLAESLERYDRILLNGAVAAVPACVTSRLKPGGHLIGALAVEGFPRLIRIERGEEGGLTHVLGAPLRISALIDRRRDRAAAAGRESLATMGAGATLT